MSVLDPEKRVKLQPKRMAYCIDEITKLGYEIFDQCENSFKFKYKDEIIQLFPFTGWHSGKSIKDGRGINNLLNQLK